MSRYNKITTKQFSFLTILISTALVTAISVNNPIHSKCNTAPVKPNLRIFPKGKPLKDNTFLHLNYFSQYDMVMVVYKILYFL